MPPSRKSPASASRADSKGRRGSAAEKAAVSAAGVGGPARPLQLDVDTTAIWRDVLPDQVRPPVAQDGEVPKLVPGIGLG